MRESVKRFWDYGFRGGDLIVACYGPAVGEFGKHERVERGDGTPVTAPELLQLVREAALRGIAGEFTGDRLSRLCFVWANLYGVAQQAFDDMRLVVQVGGDAEDALEVARGRGLFAVDGPRCRLALLADRPRADDGVEVCPRSLGKLAGRSWDVIEPVFRYNSCGLSPLKLAMSQVSEGLESWPSAEDDVHRWTVYLTHRVQEI